MSRKRLIIIHPETKEELTVEQAAELVGITPGAMRRRLSDPSWNLRKALTQKGDWDRSKNAKSRKPPAFVTTVQVPESLLEDLEKSPNAVVKERLVTVGGLTLPPLAAEPTKLVRIALIEEERDKLHHLILENKLSNLTEAIVALLCNETNVGSLSAPSRTFRAEGNVVSSELSATLEALIPQLQDWELEELIKLRLELSLIIERKKEERCDRRLEQAIVYLAERCDGASAIDGAGYNKPDSRFGKWLAGRIQNKQPIIKSHAEVALKILQKYIKQLERGGLSLPVWEAIAHQYPEQYLFTPAQEGEEHTPTRRIEIKGSKIAVYAPYDSTGKFQKDAKSIEGYEFNTFGDKGWTYPLKHLELVIEKFPESQGFVHDPNIEGSLVLVRLQQEEEQAAREREALEISSEIIRLIQSADLDAPLANGWHLRDYQKKGVEWLLAHRKGGIYDGGILADQMGLGKTLTALLAAKAMQKVYDCPIFVVAPVSLLENWERSAAIAEVQVEMFSNNYQKIPEPLEHQSYVVIFDEAHGFQDLKSKRTEKMMALSHHANCLACWLLTGTPIKNGRPINLMPLLMAVSHPLVTDKWAYQKRYCNAHQKSVGRGKTVWDVTGAAFLDELAVETEDVILSRTKAECLAELPAKTRLFKEIELEPADSKRYQEAVRSLVEDYRRRAKLGEVDEDAEALVALNYLRKVGSEFKVDAAVELAEELLDQGQQVVLFTEFLESAKTLHKKLGGELLTGETKTEERQNIVDRFQKSETKVFIGTIKAGGVGLTLTASSNVIMVDRAWTPGDCEQAEDRCHRLGQQNAVFAIWIQLGQVDKAIDDLLIQKQQRVELVLKGKRKTLQGIQSAKDLAKELLAIL